MSPVQKRAVVDAVAVAGLIYETGGNWREVFRRRQFRHIGQMHKTFKKLYELTDEEFKYVLQNGIDT